MKKEDVLKFIKSNNLAVVSTVNANKKPQASVVEFAVLDDLTVVIDLLQSSRKYKNFQTNQDTAVVIGWDNDVTVQIEGQARQLSGAELETAQKVYFAKNPRAKKWASNPDIAYFAIKPQWMRYSDLNQSPWLVKEFDLKPE